MRCSECSKLVKPVVAVDIDGTLGDYHGHFIKFAEQYLGIEGYSPAYEQVDVTEFGNDAREYANGYPLYDGSIGFKEWGCDVWDIDERTWHDIKLSYRQGGMKRSMPLYPYATEFCNAIISAGAEMWLTTTRPYLRLDNVDPDTRFWLHRHSITQYDGLLYDEFKYSKLAEYVDKSRVVAVVDDLREMWEAAAHHFGWRVPVLRRNPYNTAVKGDAYDLQECAHLVLDRISAWKETHDNSRVHTDEG